MAIYKMEINNFLVFKNDFTATFCEGINIIIGGNATGKTTLLKAMYLMCVKTNDRDIHDAIMSRREFDKENNDEGQSVRDFMQIERIDSFFPHISTRKGVICGIVDDKGVIINPDNPIRFSFNQRNDGKANLAVYGITENNTCVFIPTTEMLSHSQGLLALDRERQIPFDETHIDILAKAQLPITREITPNADSAIHKIKEIIGGEVIVENDVFYIIDDAGSKTPFTLEASGYRKLGLLWRLLRNGLLESRSILFWDEPESSLNPELG